MEKMNSELQHTLTQKFRSIYDFGITCGLSQYYSLYTNRAYISNILTNKTVYINDFTDVFTLFNSTREKEALDLTDIDFLCIEDTF